MHFLHAVRNQTGYLSRNIYTKRCENSYDTDADQEGSHTATAMVTRMLISCAVNK